MTKPANRLYCPIMTSHDYQRLAGYYAELGISGTYYLAFRDLDEYLTKFSGKSALDFGCGAGRSSRFLKKFDIEVTGVDRNQEMIAQARIQDLHGSYQVIPPGNLGQFADNTFDLIFSSFVLMEISTLDKITAIVKEMNRILKTWGKVIIIVSNAPISTCRCVSFNKDFLENQNLKNGDQLRLDITDASRTFTLYDYYWTEQDYRQTFSTAGLSVTKVLKPLGKPEDGIAWKAETTTPPFVIFILHGN
ncbi:MAG: class I SAM-dependent methyltransferase [Planctomycetes bacterium]|nr:class I SAM-dependent methyltransferase [Planctomycetota bacterium]